MLSVFLIIATCFLAYANGANDNFKGVASLHGSRTATYQTALGWATAATFLGSICSLVLAESLLIKFTGRGFVSDALVHSQPFLLSVALGTGITIIAATQIGFPVSTTHGLTGALLGSGLVAAGGDVNLRYLGTGFLLPLAISPILAVVGAGALYLALRTLRQRLGISKEWCLCVGERLEIIPTPQPPSAVTVQSAIPWFPEVSTGTATMCTERYAGRFLGIRSQSLVDGLHFVSAGIVSFARGLNDTPKIVAVLMATQALNMRWGLIAVAVAMAAGGWLNARKVAETMSHRITPMNHGQGFAANVVTALLVILASTRGLPVSTTHVSVGSLFGIGLTARTANVDVVARIVLSWVLTLPCAALFSGMLYWVLAARQG